MLRSTLRRPRLPRLKPALLACAFGLALTGPGAAFAQSAAPGAQVDSRALLELMVNKGLLTRAEADALLAQATVPVAQAAIPAGGVSGDTQTIPYIPQTVRNQIKDEVRTELANQASAEGWARPGEVAEWTKRIRLSGDIRVRAEGIRMGENNYDRSLPNFQAINAGPGYDISPGNFQSSPFLDSTQNRYRARIRARLGIDANISDWISAELRVATGNDSGPVSTNQTLGSSGPFNKYAIWLDRANIQVRPLPGLTLDFGRAANPYWTSELLFDDDLNFDGVSVSYTTPNEGTFRGFATAGFYPIFNTDLNFGSNFAGAFASKDKYLVAGQIGGEFHPSNNLAVKLAGGYFRFEHVQGKLSSPCQYYQDVCDTDATRPQFIQYGNTLFPIRNIVPNPADPVGSPEVQYFGLASKFEILNVHGQIDYTGLGSFGIRLEGDFVKNLGFNRSLVASRAINNIGPDTLAPDPNNSNGTITIPGKWNGGNTAWYANLIVGKPDLRDVGDWRLQFGYRYIQSDALLDAFGDNDFHLGGTNAKGFIVGGAYTFGKNTSLGVRWLSSDVVTGFPFSNDVVQLDLSTKF